VEEQEMDYKKTILIVDDEKMILNLLSCNLLKEGYNVIEATDGLEAISVAQEKKPDLILLDVMLPKLDGLSVCKRIKNMMNIPILMVTAKDEELDKIVGLELGADDYITKPFSIRELLARVKANLRKADVISNIRQEEKEKKANEEAIELKRTNIIKVGVLTLDLDRFEVMVNDKIVDLTLREFEVLKFLASDPGQVITRETLLEKVWGYEYYGDIRTVDVTVRRIREKIEKDTSNPKILITKRGVGYYIAT
jgi:two-component system response regulator VicR